MQIELHRNNVYQGVDLLLLVPMLFLLAILKCLLIFKENFYYTSTFTIGQIKMIMIMEGRHVPPPKKQVMGRSQKGRW